MKKENIHTIELLGKFISDDYTEDELEELFERVNTVEFETSIKELLPDSFEEVTNHLIFSKKEMNANYGDLSEKLGLMKKQKLNIFASLQKYAAILLLPLILGASLTFIYFNVKITDDPGLTFSVANGNKSYMELGDGSKMWLNSSSKLMYNPTHIREVYLEGEAYFDIAHDSKKEFKVKTEFFDVIVYGTAFSVSSFKSDNVVEVDLIEGSIGIVDNNEKLFKLKSGQSMTYDKQTKHYTIVDKNITSAPLWIESELVIRDLTAEELVNKLSAWYSVDIKLKNSDPKKRLYNLTITNESLESILNLINKLSPMNYEIDGKEVILEYK